MNLKKMAQKGILALAAVFILTACSGGETQTPRIPEPQDSAGTLPAAPATPNGQKEFGKEDLVAGGVAYGSTREDVTARFGEPDSVDEYTEGATGNGFTVLYYADGNVFWLVTTPEDGTPRLRDVSIVSQGVPGPRGLQIGDSKDKVLEAFRNDNGEPNVLYAAGTIDIFGETNYLGPCGYVARGVDYHRIVYYYPTEPYPKEIGELYMYWTHGYLHFEIESDAVSEIFWMVSAFAE